MCEQNYIFYFNDNTYIVFSLTPQQIIEVKNAIAVGRNFAMFEDTVIVLKDLRYFTKQKEQDAPESAVPDEMEQDVYEYLKILERGVKNGEKETTGGY
ncbi:hypothetical protein UFOVP453_46 [uncultured Caudovirales phage]|uniref:Uncharacterized protein n=1 Tax=uncultured Caudovirales phage TaxID=2100421 RepID=A0A6J5MGT5_9CAUD|nr:hypothetical protein UFOVP453_46 [uncultured Caudovirales phage]